MTDPALQALLDKRPARVYGVDAAFMSLEQHEGGIHALKPGDT